MQNKVLIADSWFGSVPCAAALHENGVYAIMNVKTCHKGYPKEKVSRRKIAIEVDPEIDPTNKAHSDLHCHPLLSTTAV